MSRFVNYTNKRRNKRHTGFSATTTVRKVMDLGRRVHSDWFNFQIKTNAIGFQHIGPPTCILSPPSSSRSPEIPVHNASHLTPKKLLVCFWVSIPVAARSAATPLFGLKSRVPPRTWTSVCCECYVLSVICDLCLWSLVQKSPNQCGVSECNRETSIMKKPWPTTDCYAIKCAGNHTKRLLKIREHQSNQHSPKYPAFGQSEKNFAKFMVLGTTYPSYWHQESLPWVAQYSGLLPRHAQHS